MDCCSDLIDETSLSLVPLSLLEKEAHYEAIHNFAFVPVDSSLTVLSSFPPFTLSSLLFSSLSVLEIFSPPSFFLLAFYPQLPLLPPDVKATSLILSSLTHFVLLWCHLDFFASSLHLKWIWLNCFFRSSLSIFFHLFFEKAEAVVFLDKGIVSSWCKCQADTVLVTLTSVPQWDSAETDRHLYSHPTLCVVAVVCLFVRMHTCSH